MDKIKRKPRNKMNKKVDILRPVRIEDLGTENDPCFGKHLDPKAPECQICGDCELCEVAMQQRLQVVRAKAEAEGKFKDLEPEKHADPKVIRKMVRVRIKELAKLGKKKGTEIGEIIDDIHSTYVMHGWSKKKVRLYIEKICESSENLSLINNHVKFHKT